MSNERNAKHIEYVMQGVVTESHRKALEAGMKQLYIDSFNERVLKTLAGEGRQEEEEEKPQTLKYKTQGRYGTGVTDVRRVFGGPPTKAEGTQYDYDAHERELKRRIMEQQRMMDEDRKMMERQRMMNYPQKFPLF